MSEEVTNMVLCPVDLEASIEGSVRIDDTDCGHPCWIAPTGMQLLLTSQPFKKICMRCYLKQVATGNAPSPELQQPIPGALEELTQNIGAEGAEKALTNFRIFSEYVYQHREEFKRRHAAD